MKQSLWQTPVALILTRSPFGGVLGVGTRFFSSRLLVPGEHLHAQIVSGSDAMLSLPSDIVLCRVRTKCLWCIRWCSDSVFVDLTSHGRVKLTIAEDLKL